MKIARAGYLGAAVFGVAGVLAAGPLTAQVTVTIDADDIGGVVTGAKRAGGRRLGDRRDHRPPHQVRQDRRHRRSGPLRAAGPAEGQLQGLGARLWPRRFRRRSTASRARPSTCSAMPAPNAAAAARVLPGDLLVFDDQDPGRRANFPARQRTACTPAMKSQGAVAQHRQDQRLRHLPPARQQGDAHDPARRSASSRIAHEAWARRIQSGQARPQHGQRHRPHRHAARA